MPRGKINNEDRARQLRDFSGLKFDRITPTDIDGLVEFSDRLFVLMEAKYKDPEKESVTPLPRGQRLAIERICDAIQDSSNDKMPRLSAALVLIHSDPPEKSIDFAQCPVIEYRYKKEWRRPHSPINCRKAIEKLLEMVGIPF